MFAVKPTGVILHGSRSGRAQSIQDEFNGTANYAASGIELGWHATIGEDAVALHMGYRQWGWNARGASTYYLAVEFAQPRLSDHISDGQIRAFCWFVQRAREAWPTLPLTFPTHAELPEGIKDGKTDVFPNGDAIRARIFARLAELGVTA